MVFSLTMKPTLQLLFLALILILIQQPSPVLSIDAMSASLTGKLIKSNVKRQQEHAN